WRWTTAEHGDSVLGALADIGRAVAIAPTVIDYERRETLLRPGPLISARSWAAISSGSGVRFGGERRLSHANAYLYEIITGASPRQWASLEDPQSWLAYREFCVHLGAVASRRLRQRAQDWLADAGINEPLMWSPNLDGDVAMRAVDNVLQLAD